MLLIIFYDRWQEIEAVKHPIRCSHTKYNSLLKLQFLTFPVSIPFYNIHLK